MKAPDFSYARPETLMDAISLLADTNGDAQPLAGGQSLMPMLNFRVASPDVLVDLADVPELKGVEHTADGLRIGAMTRYCELQALPGLAQSQPLIAMALPHIAHDAIRNRGTIGGSIALADPAAEMPAVMLALDAEIRLAGPNGRRSVAVDDFFLGVYETDCAPDEIITDIVVPDRKQTDVFGFYELVQRHGDYAMAGVAIAASGAEPLNNLRIGFFGVTDRAVRLPDLEAALSGTTGEITEDALKHLDAIEFLGDTKISEETRAHYAGVALKRALREMTS